jgi:hypothetical protein
MNAYDEGWDAGYHDQIPDCPYNKGTPEYDDWWSGYHQGAMNS